MTDIEITQKCASAMGHRQDRDGGFSRMAQGAGMDEPGWFPFIYNPLVDDAQAMALLKKFVFVITRGRHGHGDWKINLLGGQNADLNRAICEFVAKKEREK